MMKKQYLVTLGALSLTLAACGGSTAPAESPDSGAPVTESSEEAPADADSGIALHAPQLAQKVAEMTAQAWDAPKAAADEVMLTIRIRVDSHPVSVKTNGEGIAIVDGADGAAPGDADADLTKEQAAQIVDGETTLKKLVSEGAVASNNPDGLARFCEFLTE